MLKLADGLGLDAEAFQFLRPAAADEHLHGHDAVQGQLPRAVDDAHAAAAEFLQDFVPGEAGGNLAGHRPAVREFKGDGDFGHGGAGLAGE